MTVYAEGIAGIPPGINQLIHAAGRAFAAGPNTDPEQAFLSFSTAGNVATLLMFDRPEEVDEDTLHALSGMYNTMLEGRLGIDFDDDDAAVERLIEDADDVLTNFKRDIAAETHSGRPAPTGVALLEEFFKRRVDVLTPESDPYASRVMFEALGELAYEVMEETEPTTAFFELVSSGYLLGAGRLLGLDVYEQIVKGQGQQAIQAAQTYLEQLS